MNMESFLAWLPSLLLDIVVASIPSVGFALLFNVPQRALKYCALLGGGGHGLRFLLLHLGVHIIPASLVASLCIGFSGIYLARKFHAHPKVFTVAALIPMIPGVLAHKATVAMLSMYQHGVTYVLLERWLSAFLDAVGIIGVLVLGLVLPGMLFYRRQPVV